MSNNVSPLKIKRRKSKKASSEIELSEHTVVEKAIDGVLFKVDSGIQKKSRTVSFDLVGNRLLEKLTTALKESNTMVCRAALRHLSTVAESLLTEAMSERVVKKGSSARKGLSPVELKELLSFPANRTLGASIDDNMLLERFKGTHGMDVAHTYRTALLVFDKLSINEQKLVMSSIPKPKRGAPKRS